MFTNNIIIRGNKTYTKWLEDEEIVLLVFLAVAKSHLAL
jgi:hypothetical protein